MPPQEATLSDFLDYWSDSSRLETLLEQTIDHTQLVLLVLAVAIPFSVALGILGHRVPALRNLIVSTTATFLTIPSLALFAILIYVVGLGTPPAAIALFLYAQLAIVRNTISGLNSVPSAVSESAKGMGMGYWQRLFRVEMPIAWPVIIAGIRVSTQMIVGIAAIAALVGSENLGTQIFGGLRRLGSAGSAESIFGGTIAVVLLAFAFDLIFLVIGRMTTSRGIRG